VLGHRLQVAAFGDLDKSARRLLRDESDGEGNRNTAPFDRRDAQTREGIALKPGALLVREWQGKLERVMVLEDGFAWNGKNFGSLSQIAKAMTGTNWNGHRFFGLRQTKGAPVTTGAVGSRRGKAPRDGQGSIESVIAHDWFPSIIDLMDMAVGRSIGVWVKKPFGSQRAHHR
jgi:hypothetical protein